MRSVPFVVDDITGTLTENSYLLYYCTYYEFYLMLLSILLQNHSNI